MLNICFFNQFHNGDCFGTKQFLVDLINKLPAEISLSYSHFNHPKILSDLPIPFVEMPPKIKYPVWPPSEMSLTPFILVEDTLYVNTWLGCYVDEIAKEKRGIITSLYDLNWKSYYRVWTYIYDGLNERLGTKLELEPEVEDYFPSIDYSKFEVSGYDQFLGSLALKKKVLISNGKAMSNQSLTNHTLGNVINYNAYLFPDVAFVCTERFDTLRTNVFFTDDIQKREGSDLNEISYFSTFCDAIVGRNSGPFLFTNTKQNLETKTFLSFSRDERECFPYECKTKDFRYVRDESNEVMIAAISAVVQGL